MSKEKKSKIHYSWFVLSACLMVTTFYMSIVLNCAGLFLVPVSESLNISRSQFSLNTTVLSIAMIIVSVNAWKIYSKISIKNSMRIAAIILPIAYAGFGVAPNIYVFYILSFIVGTCFALCGFIPISTLITNWFIDDRGLATGLAFTGSGLGGMIFQPIIGQLLISVGWKQTYIILAIIMFLVVVPFVLFFVKDKPSDIGLMPYEKANKQVSKKAVITEDDEGLSAKEAFKTHQFILFFIAVAITTGVCSSFIQQFPAYLTDIGYSITQAANAGALSLGSLALGKILIGKLYDFVGVFKGNIIALVCLSLTFVIVLYARNSMFLYITIILSGIGLTFSSVGYSVSTMEIFGKKHYGAIYGIINGASSIGSAIGSPLANIIFDKTNSYNTTWVIWSIITGLSLIACVYIMKIKPVLKEK